MIAKFGGISRQCSNERVLIDLTAIVTHHLSLKIQEPLMTLILVYKQNTSKIMAYLMKFNGFKSKTIDGFESKTLIELGDEIVMKFKRYFTK